jgi:hypothetical protein
MDAVFWYRLAAHSVLVLHAALVCFVVFGPVLIVAGNLRGWQWVNARSFRVAHAAAILTVIAEAWIGIVCPLTTLEMWLRTRAGAVVYPGGFVEYWLPRILYHDFHAWVFTLAYSLFGLLVLAIWWRFPPRRRSMNAKG